MTEPYVPHAPATTEGFYNGTSVHPESGRVSTPLQDIMNLGPKAGGFLSGAFNSVSEFMDDHPLVTKGVSFTLALIGLWKVGENFGMTTMFGSGAIGKTFSMLFLFGAAFLAANSVSDWASNKGADKRAGNTGRLENTATVPAPATTTQQGGTAGAFNNNATGVVVAQAAPQPSSNTAAAPESPRAEPLSGLNNVFAPP